VDSSSCARGLLDVAPTLGVRIAHGVVSFAIVLRVFRYADT
jgi:hypothetical protein